MKFRILLFLLILFSLTGCGEAEPDALPPSLPHTPQLSITTYTYDDCKLLSLTPNKKAPGTDVNCTAMQGMAASNRYLYCAKQKDDRYAQIFQFDSLTEIQRTMTLYQGIIPVAIDSVGHCNDMVVYDDASTRYLLCATANTPDTSVAMPCLTRFALDEENAALHDAGWFNLVSHSQWGSKVYIPAGAIRCVATTGDASYFLSKDKDDFYWFKIPANASGGTWEQPQELQAVRLFTIDNRNALFSDGKGGVFTAENLESWTNQGMGYSPEIQLLYVPLYNPSIGDGAESENVILTFDLSGMVTPEALEAVTQDQQRILYPTTLNFYLREPEGNFFELESCVFLLDNHLDQRLHFNTNGDVNASEGIWATAHTFPNAQFTGIVDENSILYTVNYEYNVFATAPSQWEMDAANYHFDMRTPTRHIDGIQTLLRINTFVRSGYAFLGWQLHRQSDDTWLCTDGAWYPADAIPAGVEISILPDRAPVDHLTQVSGDVITAWAQWKKR